jgi:Bardet-Biedl syndrome 9 protein
VIYTYPGAPRISTAKIKLPLKLVVKAAPPVKNAECKLTLDGNKPTANLNEIFPGKSDIGRQQTHG